MSEGPQGPGWWQASDGRWYPPQQHPSQAPQPYPPQPYSPQPYQAQPGFQPQYGKGGPPAPVRSGGGVPKALIVVGVIVVVVGVLGYAAVSFATNLFTDKLIGSGDCSMIDKDEVDAVLDGQFDVIQLGGITKIATPALDSRVIADATTCWATETTTENVRLVRIARMEGGAAERFAQERTLAQGVKEDRGGGITVESQPYFNKDVDFGDEAFCTTTDFTGSSGILVRRGDTLVYVSLTSGGVPELAPGGADGGAIKFADDDAHCDQARALAEKVG